MNHPKPSGKWAYYNEHDPFAAAWLRELIADGLIAQGEVDQRSIEDVRPVDLTGFTQCHFFAGIGIWSHVLRRAGWADSEPVWTGSCPCQPFSAAGFRQGLADERHLWPAWLHLIRVCRPPILFGEQVASTDGLGWLDLVSADLEGEDYAFAPFDLCSAGFSGFHARQRLYWVADADGGERRHSWPLQSCGQHRKQPEGLGDLQGIVMVKGNDGWARPLQSGVFPLVDAHPGRLELVRGYGNAIDAEVATRFVEAVMEMGQVQRQEAA